MFADRFTDCVWCTLNPSGITTYIQGGGLKESSEGGMARWKVREPVCMYVCVYIAVFWLFLFCDWSVFPLAVCPSINPRGMSRCRSFLLLMQVAAVRRVVNLVWVKFNAWAIPISQLRAVACRSCVLAALLAKLLRWNESTDVPLDPSPTDEVAFGSNGGAAHASTMMSIPPVPPRAPPMYITPMSTRAQPMDIPPMPTRAPPVPPEGEEHVDIFGNPYGESYEEWFLRECRNIQPFYPLPCLLGNVRGQESSNEDTPNEQPQRRGRSVGWSAGEWLYQMD